MKYILLTGASTGIGYETSKFLIQNGYFVFGSVRKTEDAQRLEKDFGQNFKALIFDVRDTVQIAKAKTEVQEIIGTNYLAGLINNAGIVVFGPIQHLPIEEFENQMAVNVSGVLKVTQAFLPLLGAQLPKVEKPGKIINISSVSGLFTNPFLIPYCASKHALEAITDGMRREFLLYGIDAISIQPGPIKTPIWDKASMDDNPYNSTNYAPLMAQTNKLIAKTAKNGLEPIVLAKLIHKVLKKRRPKTHYIVMKNSLPMKLVRMMPSRWVDNIFKKQMQKALNRATQN